MLQEPDVTDPDVDNAQGGDNKHPEDGHSEPEGRDIVREPDTDTNSTGSGNNDVEHAIKNIESEDDDLGPGEFDLDDILQEVAEKAVANPKIKLGKIIQRLADKREIFGDDMSMEDILTELDAINYDLESEETAKVDDINVLPPLDVPPKRGANIEGASVCSLSGDTPAGEGGGGKGVDEGEYAEKRDYLDHVDDYEGSYDEQDFFEGAHEGEEYTYDSRLDVDHSLAYYKYDRDSQGRRLQAGKDAAGDRQSSTSRRPRNKALDSKRNSPGTTRAASKRTSARAPTRRSQRRPLSRRPQSKTVASRKSSRRGESKLQSFEADDEDTFLDRVGMEVTISLTFIVASVVGELYFMLLNRSRFSSGRWNESYLATSFVINIGLALLLESLISALPSIATASDVIATCTWLSVLYSAMRMYHEPLGIDCVLKAMSRFPLIFIMLYSMVVLKSVAASLEGEGGGEDEGEEEEEEEGSASVTESAFTEGSSSVV